jgi:hypothetical protein
MGPEPRRWRKRPRPPEGIVGEANIASDDVERELEGHAADRSARSIRQESEVLANFHKLARYGLGFDYMAFPNHMKPSCGDRARRWPHRRISRLLQ